MLDAMRYSKEHSDRVRERFIRMGGRYVKERGVHGAGVDGIAKFVGLSGAALYTHFKSKKQYLSRVLHEELVATTFRFLEAHGSIEQAIAQYLSLEHARNIPSGCALPALISDVPRSDKSFRTAFEKGLGQIVEALSAKLEHPNQAFGVLAAAVGGVAIARALGDDKQAKAVLSSTRELIFAALR